MAAVTRLFDYLNIQFDEFPQEKAFGSRNTAGDWEFYSSADLITESRKLASGLISLGFQKGDKIAIVAYKNRPEWYIADLATQYLGIINVPLYPTISSNEYEYIMNEAEVKACFVGAGDLLEKVTVAQQNVPSLKDIFAFDQETDAKYFKELYDEANLAEVQRIADTVQTDDLATIIYTSGTTGNPKGVMLTHENIITAVDETLVSFPLEKGSRVLSFLPFCHIFERACIYGYTQAGVNVYCTGTDNLGGEGGDLANVKPAFFTTVPRLLEKVYEKIYNKGLQLTGIKKKLFFWALSLTKDYEHGKQYSGWRGIQQKIADKLIFSKWREALGGNLKGIVTGAAPCPTQIIQVFSSAGIPIMEGYGLTETSPTLAINRFDGASKVGTVGVINEGVDILIDNEDGTYLEGEGEILARGKNVMQGYYKKPEQTASVFTEREGKRWFKTGDIGKLVDGPKGVKYLKITDRKKELLKTSGGKYVAPAPIEGKLKSNFLIEQCMIVGDGKKFVSALIVPAQEALESYCKECGIGYSSLKEAINSEEVLQKFQTIIDKTNPQFSKVEQIKKFKLLDCTWEAVRPNGEPTELTPTLKLKRRVIGEKYQKDIEDMYA